MKFYEVYDVELNSSLAMFRDCNFENGKAHISAPSVNSSEFENAVTRMSTEALEGGFGTRGQCGENTLVGSWLTFPKAGKCGPGQKVGDAGCTWRSTAFKSISMECMTQYNSTPNHSGWDNAWASSYLKAPFPNVQRHIGNAVKVCPDVTGSLG